MVEISHRAAFLSEFPFAFALFPFALLYVSASF
jgi:hypothetical protein